MNFLTVELLLEALKDAPKDSVVYYPSDDGISFWAALGVSIVEKDNQFKVRIS